MKTPFCRLAGFELFFLRLLGLVVGFRTHLPHLKTSPLAVALVAFILCSQLSRAEERLFYGLLHAHTYFSDGSGTPEDAYRTAKGNGVAFFAVTEHNHDAAEDLAEERRDGILISKNHALYTNAALVQITRQGQNVTVKSVKRAATDSAATGFLPIYGQEFSSISSGNHVNVLGVNEVITDTNGRYDLLFARLAALESQSPNSIVVQLNHPDVHSDLFYGGQKDEIRSKMYNDYGFDDYGESFATLVGAADKFVHLIEVLSGPKATVDIRFDSYRYDDHGNDYYFYLIQGFHISPSVGHDDHYLHWGNKSPARMGVYANAPLTRASLFEAIRLNRTFATEDSDLELKLSVNGNPMGSTLTLPTDSPLAFRVEVKDAGQADTTYEATLISGTVRPQTRQTLRKYVEQDGKRDTKAANQSGIVSFEGYLASGDPEFYYVLVEQSDGNRAWSAPVWINHGGTQPTTLFVWTSGNSNYYHKQGCVAADRILAGNVVQGVTPPAGRVLHDCKFPAADNDH
jgi:hypothetical protein